MHAVKRRTVGLFSFSWGKCSSFSWVLQGLVFKEKMRKSYKKTPSIRIKGVQPFKRPERIQE